MRICLKISLISGHLTIWQQTLLVCALVGALQNFYILCRFETTAGQLVFSFFVQVGLWSKLKKIIQELYNFVLNPSCKWIIIAWSLTKLLFVHVDQKSKIQYRTPWENIFMIILILNLKTIWQQILHIWKIIYIFNKSKCFHIYI